MKNLIKYSVLITFLIFVTNKAFARTCDESITDEWPDYRYNIDVPSAIVIDKKTQLMWKRCSEGASGNDCENGTASLHTWQEALLLQDSTNSAAFAGFDDWRLPNVEELRSLAALNCFDPAINENAFPNTPIYWFWSSSPIAENDAFAWDVYFGQGNDTGNNRVIDLNVRLVRTHL